MAKEIGQFGATTSQLKTYKGVNKQVVINRDNHRIHVMDGSKAGGIPHALKSEVDAAQAKADAALPLSGGTMTGNVKFSQNSALLYKNTNDGSITIRGGGNGFAYGSSMVVYGKDHATNPGAFELLAHDGTNVRTLKGKPNGPLTWNGKNVITSAGGNIDGDVTFSRWKHIATVDDANGFDICGGTSGTDGAYFSVRGKNATSYQGSFLAVSMNTDGTKHMLIGNKDGKLTWDDNDVITSAGGTLTDSIVVSGNNAFVKQGADNSSITLFGGSTYLNGAWMTLYGKDYPDRNGYIDLLARDASQSSTLRLCPNGRATWGGKEIERVNSKGTNYIRYESGLQIVFGVVEMSRTATVTFPVAFKDTQYRLFDTKYSNYNVWFTDFQTAGVTINTGEGARTTVKYTAIGYWK